MKSTANFTPLPPEYLLALPSPSVGKRIALNLYELLVLLGVGAFTFLLPHLVVGVVWHVTAPSWFLFAHLYLAFAFYFDWYWTRTGQTLAMQTWRVQVINVEGRILTRPEALFRYAMASLWIFPAAIVLYITTHLWGAENTGTLLSIVFFSMTLFLWPVTALLDRPQKRSWVDRLSKTRLVQLPRLIPHPISGGEK